MLERSVLSFLSWAQVLGCPVLTGFLFCRKNTALPQSSGAASARASLPAAGEGGRALLFNYLVMRTSLAFGTGCCRCHGSSDVLDWCSWLVGGMELALTSDFFFFVFFQSSFPSVSVPAFPILEFMYFLSRSMVILDRCQSRRKPGLIGSALAVSDFLDGFVCVWFVVVWAFLFVCCLLNPSAHFGA